MTPADVQRPGYIERVPEPGYEWRPCLCGQIDPEDRPCAICKVRWLPVEREVPEVTP